MWWILIIVGISLVVLFFLGYWAYLKAQGGVSARKKPAPLAAGQQVQQRPGITVATVMSAVTSRWPSFSGWLQKHQRLLVGFLFFGLTQVVLLKTIQGLFRQVNWLAFEAAWLGVCAAVFVEKLPQKVLIGWVSTLTLVGILAVGVWGVKYHPTETAQLGVSKYYSTLPVEKGAVVESQMAPDLAETIYYQFGDFRPQPLDTYFREGRKVGQIRVPPGSKPLAFLRNTAKGGKVKVVTSMPGRKPVEVEVGPSWTKPDLALNQGTTLNLAKAGFIYGEVCYRLNIPGKVPEEGLLIKDSAEIPIEEDGTTLELMAEQFDAGEVKKEVKLTNRIIGPLPSKPVIQAKSSAPDQPRAVVVDCETRTFTVTPDKPTPWVMIPLDRYYEIKPLGKIVILFSDGTEVKDGPGVVNPLKETPREAKFRIFSDQTEPAEVVVFSRAS